MTGWGHSHELPVADQYATAADVSSGSRLCENSEIVSRRRIWNEFLRSAEPVLGENGRKPTEIHKPRHGRSSFHTVWVMGGGRRQADGTGGCP